ncbi:ComF family protein [Streptomyces sp. gCLA4]|uniref:ComF family protein n=1 Tax=Streptomyces sp. gCLA4 TaxID=1873416 RepID=UPI001C7F3F88|nr:ComF family protein [Streptomyces sp. gCLA4]
MTHAAGLPARLVFPQCRNCAYRFNGTTQGCAECAASAIRPLAEHHCGVCSQTLGSAGAKCGNIICDWDTKTRSFIRVDALALYATPLEQTIKEYKYGLRDGSQGWGVIFGRLIVGWLHAHAAEVADIDLIIGNPSAPDRTPIQHIETMMRAAHAEDSIGRWPIADPDSPVLVKTAETKKSAGGGVRWHEKMEAAKEHAAALQLRQNVEGKRILLVDDVFTTGANFHTVGKLLMTEGGAKEVRGLVLARVPFGGRA